MRQSLLFRYCCCCCWWTLPGITILTTHVRARPPTRSVASRIVTDTLPGGARSSRVRAAVRPAKPAPTITTFLGASAAMGGCVTAAVDAVMGLRCMCLRMAGLARGQGEVRRPDHVGRAPVGGTTCCPQARKQSSSLASPHAAGCTRAVRTHPTIQTECACVPCGSSQSRLHLQWLHEARNHPRGSGG